MCAAMYVCAPYVYSKYPRIPVEGISYKWL